ncbi:hypothetical protein BH23ACT2_BH23ACT2_10910 [soil metagenome]
MTDPGTPEGPDPPAWSPADVVIASTANERTAMAWSRTALAWGAMGAVVVRFQAEQELVSVRSAAGVALIACGAATWLMAKDRYRRRDRALRAGGPLPDPRSMLFAVAVVVTAAIVVVLVGELVGLADPSG